ncbi:MAG: hypothetical protein R3F47_11075 [Gammaproteobacteria bacterium]
MQHFLEQVVIICDQHVAVAQGELIHQLAALEVFAGGIPLQQQLTVVAGRRLPGSDGKQCDFLHAIHERPGETG